MDDARQIGHRLREFGLSHFPSLGAFAKALGISQPQLSNYLVGGRTPGNRMQERVRNLGCDLTWLMTGRTQEELEKASKSFFVRKARELLPDKFATLDYLGSIGLDTTEKVKRVCDPQGIAEDVAMVMRERLVKYQSKRKGRKKNG
jgi:transcriptional regulator with XRE-family HTH domain